MRKTSVSLVLIALAGCQSADHENTADVNADNPATDAQAASSLAEVLATRPDELQARYPYRHPKETLEFFGIEPGMTVVEGLPGEGGWYTQVLVPYLGEKGCLIGADYAPEMYSLFPFANDEYMAKKATWKEDFLATARGWDGATDASVDAFVFGSMPDSMVGTADIVFFARVLHNLARFETSGGYLSTALNESYRALKPGGIFAVVQHEARDEMPDTFADGSHGYLKKAFVIAAAERAGFEFVAETDVNQNSADKPSEDDIVWRLPPSLVTSADNPELRAEYEAVGESNRMTLKFRKPSD